MDTNKLEKVIDKAVAALGYEFVGVLLGGSKNGLMLRVFIDSEQGVNLDDCAKATRQIKTELAVEEVLESDYSLEVSSPGINRPLFKMADYKKHIGEKIVVRLATMINEQKSFTGILISAENDAITLDIAEKQQLIPLSCIKISKLVKEI